MAGGAWRKEMQRDEESGADLMGFRNPKIVVGVAFSFVFQGSFEFE